MSSTISCQFCLFCRCNYIPGETATILDFLLLVQNLNKRLDIVYRFVYNFIEKYYCLKKIKEICVEMMLEMKSIVFYLYLSLDHTFYCKH